MKFSVVIALLFSTVTIPANCQIPDLSDPDQFIASVRREFEGSFNGPEPQRREHVENYYTFLNATLEYTPCNMLHTDLKFYRSRVEAMFRTYTSCVINSVKIDDEETENNGLKIVFLIDASYKSYTGRFSIYPSRYYISKPDQKSAYKIYIIEEAISCDT